MSKNRQLEDAFFPVDMEPIYVEDKKVRLIHFEAGLRYKKIENFRAVTDRTQGRVFAVMAKDYQLVTNKEAVDLAKICFKSIFNIIDANEMIFFNLIMPGTRSFCHIDFVHKDLGFELFPKDIWFPYLRVTNSYNRMFALKYEIGFCRGICRNGVIFGKDNIEFKFNHHSTKLKEIEPSFKLKSGDFLGLEASFIAALKNLKRFHVPSEMMWPLVCMVLGFNIKNYTTYGQDETLERHQAYVSMLTNTYFNEMGQNGYAALNVITDFASSPQTINAPEVRINKMQKRTGEWVAQFVEAIEDRNFDFAKYLGEYAQLIEIQ